MTTGIVQHFLLPHRGSDTFTRYPSPCGIENAVSDWLRTYDTGVTLFLDVETPALDLTASY